MAELANSGFMSVLYIAGALFIARFILKIFGFPDWWEFMRILGLIAVVSMVIAAIGKLMGYAQTMSQGKWPQ